jgi:hypothetical protein
VRCCRWQFGHGRSAGHLLGTGRVAATFDAAQAAGSSVEILAADGTVVDTYTAVKDFSSLIYSSADIDSGAEYQVVVDGGTTTVTAGELPGDRQAAFRCLSGSRRTLSA